MGGLYACGNTLNFFFYGSAGSADPLTVKLGLGGPVTTLYNMGREGDEILC